VQSTDAENETLSPLQLRIKDDQSVESTSLSIDTNLTLPDSLPDSPLTRIHDVVTLLFELGPSLVDPSPHNRLERPAHPDAAQYDINHVRAGFPHAHESLIDRLGRANWERRQYMRKFRLAHEENPHRAQKLDPTEPALQKTKLSLLVLASATEDSDRSFSDTEESAVAEPYDRGKTLETDISVPESPTVTAITSARSEFHFSVDETQSTAGTEPSKGVTHASQMTRPVTTRYRFPLPPNPNGGFTGKTFLCPFCFHMVSDMNSLSEWT
jgi:hypothetical protein